MALSSSDILFRRSEAWNDTTSNGGKISATTITNGAKNGIFPDVRNTERVNGGEAWRKVFVHFSPTDNSQALDVKIVPYAPTPAGSRVLAYVGTQTDTQGTISATPGRSYGAALVQGGSLALGSTGCTVTLEDSSDVIFAAGDTVYLSDQDDISSSTGSAEYVTLQSVTGSGLTRALTFTTSLANAYAGNIRASSVIVAGDVLAAAVAGSVTGSGTFTIANVQLAPRSAVQDTWTLTFTSATAYTVSGAASGLVGSGTVSGNFAPTNTAFGGPFLTIPATAFGGVFAAGNTVTFSTSPAAKPLWLRRITPANTPSFATDQLSLLVDCETA